MIKRQEAFERFYEAGQFVVMVKRKQCTGLPGPAKLEGRPIPRWLDEEVALNFEPGNPHNHEDLGHDGGGISVTLTFETVPHHLQIPWRAVVMMQNADCAVAWRAPEPEEPKGGLRVVK